METIRLIEEFKTTKFSNLNFQFRLDIRTELLNKINEKVDQVIINCLRNKGLNISEKPTILELIALGNSRVSSITNFNSNETTYYLDGKAILIISDKKIEDNKVTIEYKEL